MGRVLKRECSDSRRHVFIPKELERLSVRSLTKKLDMLVLDGAEWLSQTFVAELETMGELHVYLYHGEVSHVIHTSWGNKEDLRANVLNELWSLEELRHCSFILFIGHLLKYFLINSAILSTKRTQRGELFIREGGTMLQRVAARNQLYDFVQQTFQSLVNRERVNFTSPFQSSIELMCRIDIGIMRNESSRKWEYFANEVERGFLSCLFGSLGHSLVCKAADEMMEDLIQWLDIMYESV
jgi:hypothetical protein